MELKFFEFFGIVGIFSFFLLIKIWFQSNVRYSRMRVIEIQTVSSSNLYRSNFFFSLDRIGSSIRLRRIVAENY